MLALKLALSLLLLPRIGVIGAALATVGAETLLLLILARGFPARSAAAAAPAAADGRGRRSRCWRWLAARHDSAGARDVGGRLVFAGGVLIGRVLAADDWDLLYRLAAAVPGGALILSLLASRGKIELVNLMDNRLSVVNPVGAGLRRAPTRLSEVET